MSTQTQPASEGDVLSFLEKLAKFHETLPPSEQAILDDMTAAILGGAQGDTQGYTFTLSPLGTAFQSPQFEAKYYYYYRQVADRQAAFGG
jgi:hypothetical protein